MQSAALLAFLLVPTQLIWWEEDAQIIIFLVKMPRLLTMQILGDTDHSTDDLVQITDNESDSTSTDAEDNEEAKRSSI